MNKFKIIVFNLTLLLLLTFSAFSQGINADMVKSKKTNTAQERLLIYKNEEKKGNVTTSLYANIGELYYSFKKPSLAILYFEKGLALSPLNLRLLANRKKALDLCDAEVVANNSNFYEQEIVFIKIIESMNIVLTIILIGSWTCYFLARRNSFKTVVQERCKATALFSILILLLVYCIHRKEQLHTYGLLRDKTLIHSGPSLKAKVINHWNEGYQITIVNTYGVWVKVEAYDHQSGWLQQGDLLYPPR
jgi:hypothetical protein